MLKEVLVNFAWVTRPERPKGAKDEVKQARRAQSRPEGPLPRSRAPEGPLDFYKGVSTISTIQIYLWIN